MRSWRPPGPPWLSKAAGRWLLLHVLCLDDAHGAPILVCPLHASGPRHTVCAPCAEESHCPQETMLSTLPGRLHLSSAFFFLCTYKASSPGDGGWLVLRVIGASLGPCCCCHCITVARTFFLLTTNRVFNLSWATATHVFWVSKSTQIVALGF